MAASGPRGVDGPATRWRLRDDERRQHILDAAVALAQESGPGAVVKVRQVAERAGVSRAVVHGHFKTRAELDRAVRARVLGMMREELLSVVTLDGTISDIIRRIVSTYVGWAVEHRSLHRLAESEGPGEGLSEMHAALEEIAHQVEDLITVGSQMLGLQLDEDDTAALDPLVFGLVGGVSSAVRRWTSRPERVPAAPVFVELVTRSVWDQVDSHARSHGLVLDPDVPLEDLIATALEQAAGAAS